ncbi:protein-arginine kinase activator protein McsA [Bacillus carboniphilus]|uniref:Protein-arginine kinase activator protein McsA n=1 Tax=Bacillus carboniphilus TaxID=86663 RepID=A0ABP3FQC9_9BACI
MLCQECHQRPATLHLTKIINGEKTEVHLCEHCAQDKGDMMMFQGGPGFSVHHLLAGMLSGESGFPKSNKQHFDQPHGLKCDHCGLTYRKFSAIGKFGCAHCYESFKDSLQPVLRRLHGGNTVHSGKIPQRAGGTIHTKKKLQELKNHLKDLIGQEEFEKAAQVRDEIRALEKEINSASKGGEE